MLNLDIWKNDRSMARSPLEDVWDLFNDLDRRFYAPNMHRTTAERMMAPACDVAETEDNFLITFDVPGLKKEDINIEATGRQLVISGERKRDEEFQNGNAHRVERSYGKFYRTFDLPEGTNTEVIEATCENGVLKIAVPKAEASKTRKIQITEGGKSFLKRLSSKHEAKAVNA